MYIFMYLYVYVYIHMYIYGFVRAGSNHFFWVLGLFWSSPRSGDVRYKTTRFEKTIRPLFEGWSSRSMLLE